MLAEEIVESVPELQERPRSRAAAGRAHEHELQGDDRHRAYVVRVAGEDTSLLAIDRENEVHNTIAAAEVGVGARVVAYAARARRSRARVHRGTRRSPQRTCAAATSSISSRMPCRRLHGARRFRDDFDMFEIQRSYLRIVQDRGFRLPDRYLEFEPQVEAIEEAMRVRAGRPCRATTTCWRRTSSTSATEFRLIDYEYSGNNDACFELGNVWSESNLSLEQLDRLDRRSTTAGRHRARWRAPAVGPHVQIRLDAVGLDPGRHLRRSTSTSGRGRMEKYERAVQEFDSPGFERLLEDVQAAD